MNNNDMIYVVVIKPDQDIYKDFKIWIANEHLYDIICNTLFYLILF